MNLPTKARDEQRYMEHVMRGLVNKMFVRHIVGVMWLLTAFLNFYSGGWQILLALMGCSLVKFTSDALTKHRKDLARLRFMYEQMKDGLYLKEALREFNPKVRQYLINEYIHGDILT